MGSLGWLPYLPLIEVGVFYEHPIASSAILSKIEGNDWYERRCGWASVWIPMCRWEDEMRMFTAILSKFSESLPETKLPFRDLLALV